MIHLYFKTSAEWREWLKTNHMTSAGVWLIFYKKETGKPSLDYDGAVDEALCFGWIDSIIRKIDDEQYARKFTLRNDNSKWSELNKKRVETLIRDGRMTEIGLAKIEAARLNGQWDKQDRPKIQFELPPEFEAALNGNEKARRFFDQLTPTGQKEFIVWVATAKRQETRDKRIKESIQLLDKGQRLGLR
jgi:uncharacterized protein YdeI (YjbR/CyaY-like superfamily)